MIARIILLIAATSLAAAKPNIVVLYSDDAGYADFGFQPNCAPEMINLTPQMHSGLLFPLTISLARQKPIAKGSARVFL